MTAPDLTKLTFHELMQHIESNCEMEIGEYDLAYYDGWDELHRRAQANDALRSAVQDVLAMPKDHRSFHSGVFVLKWERMAELAAAPAAQPTPAAPVTDAEIEAAITALTVDARREADALRVNPEASGTATEKRANRQVQLLALIARRVASAGAAPVDSEREAAIDAWREKVTSASIDREGGERYPDEKAAGKSHERFVVLRAEIDEGVAMMRSAPPAPAGDQDAKLRELREWAVAHTHKDSWGVDVQYGVVDEIDRLLAAPAASAIAAAPEAPAWREKLDAAAAQMGDDHGYAASRALRGFVTALREQVESHARRIEALERANNKEAGK